MSLLFREALKFFKLFLGLHSAVFLQYRTPCISFRCLLLPFQAVLCCFAGTDLLAVPLGMPTFVASKFSSQQNYSENEDRFAQNACTVEELPMAVSTLNSGGNIMIRHTGAGTEPGEEDYQAYGILVFWTTYAAVDQAWKLIRDEFLQDRLGQAVAIAARKQKPDWYIDEPKRPFGDCRLTVYIPHSSNTSYHTQAARQIADLLTGVNISNIFYVANTDVDQTKSVPTAARRTQPVYESPNHHLVYVHPAATPGSSNSSASSWQNPVTDRGPHGAGNSQAHGMQSGCDSDRWQQSRSSGQAAQRLPDSSGQNNTYCKPASRQGRGADSDRW